MKIIRDFFEVKKDIVHSFTTTDTIKLFATYDSDCFADIEEKLNDVTGDTFPYINSYKTQSGFLKVHFKFDGFNSNYKNSINLSISRIGNGHEFFYTNVFAEIHLNHFIHQYYNTEIVNTKVICKDLNSVIKSITGKGFIYSTKVAITEVHISKDIITSEVPKYYLPLLSFFPLSYCTLSFDPKMYNKTLSIFKSKKLPLVNNPKTDPEFYKNNLGCIYDKSKKLNDDKDISGEYNMFILRFEYRLKGQKKRNKNQRLVRICKDEISVADIIKRNWDQDITKEIYNRHFGKLNDKKLYDLVKTTSHHSTKLEKHNLSTEEISIDNAKLYENNPTVYRLSILNKSKKERARTKSNIDARNKLILGELLRSYYGESNSIGLDLIIELRNKWGRFYDFEEQGIYPNIYKIYQKSNQTIKI